MKFLCVLQGHYCPVQQPFKFEPVVLDYIAGALDDFFIKVFPEIYDFTAGRYYSMVLVARKNTQVLFRYDDMLGFFRKQGAIKNLGIEPSLNGGIFYLFDYSPGSCPCIAFKDNCLSRIKRIKKRRCRFSSLAG